MLVVNVEQREAVFNHLVDYCPLIRSTRLFKTLSTFSAESANLASMQQSIAPHHQAVAAGRAQQLRLPDGAQQRGRPHLQRPHAVPGVPVGGA